MKERDVLERAFAMPLTNPAYPPGPYRFVDREYLIITYRTDPEKLRAVVPEPLEIEAPLVKYEFIRMPDSTGFGDYTESGQVIPVTFRGRKGAYTHCMFLNDHPPIAGGRELWGFPKKLGSPSLRAEIDTLVGTLDYGPIRVATGTMGYKHRDADASVPRGVRRHVRRAQPGRYADALRVDRSSHAGWRQARGPRSGSGDELGRSGLAFRSGGDPQTARQSAGVGRKPTTLQLKGTAGPAPVVAVAAEGVARPEAWRPNPILARVLAKTETGATAS